MKSPALGFVLFSGALQTSERRTPWLTGMSSWGDGSNFCCFPRSSEQWVRRAPGLVTLSMELLFMAWGAPKAAEWGAEPSGCLSPFLG